MAGRRAQQRTNRRLKAARVAAGLTRQEDLARACTEYGRALFGPDYSVSRAMIGHVERDARFVVGDRTRTVLTGVLGRTDKELGLPGRRASLFAQARKKTGLTQEQFAREVVRYARDKLGRDVTLSRASVALYDAEYAWPGRDVAESVRGVLGAGEEDFAAMRPMRSRRPKQPRRATPRKKAQGDTPQRGPRDKSRATSQEKPDKNTLRPQQSRPRPRGKSPAGAGGPGSGWTLSVDAVTRALTHGVPPMRAMDVKRTSAPGGVRNLPHLPQARAAGPLGGGPVADQAKGAKLTRSLRKP